MTGNPKRQASFGFKKSADGIEDRIFAFDQFTFPACNICNNEFADLEGQVKPIIETIITGGSITTEMLSICLDWFDKVRVGIWLGMIMLDKTHTNPELALKVEPHFHIKSRIGQFDRMLIIEKFKSDRKKLNMGGIESFSFQLAPTAFTLSINNVCFTNISTVFLASRRLGFPYPTHSFLYKDRDEMGFDVVNGRNRIMNPIIRKNIRENGRIFIQPMFANDLSESHIEEYNSAYVKDHSLDYKKGIGTIFEQCSRDYVEYSSGEDITFNIDENLYEREFTIRSLINIYEWQNWITSLHTPDVSDLTADQKRFIKFRFGLGQKYNKKLIKHYEKML
ncbi:hypothetical protein ACMXYX_06645 [Neptuniibacter sp. QD72_48]|uniref:hypothetical protein n=1 Tax=unclassified Neptuniibacter TaxID=2630693 RepID=UPI0039F51F39